MTTDDSLLLQAAIMIQRLRTALRLMFVLLCVSAGVAIAGLVVVGSCIYSRDVQIRDLKYTQEGLLGTIEQLHNELRTERERHRADHGTAVLPGRD